ncbi:hypothetical protein Tcan_09566 [Toxocara canis]|uniref:Uncharacterized protein n=1 Tax=Toxocara canis TaxID=6265 RepID=A0A0B2VHM6_TOXCA|nr:hypothetical protein Tcan_09566 [Toxocara canis]
MENSPQSVLCFLMELCFPQDDDYEPLLNEGGEERVSVLGNSRFFHKSFRRLSGYGTLIDGTPISDDDRPFDFWNGKSFDHPSDHKCGVGMNRILFSSGSWLVGLLQYPNFYLPVAEMVHNDEMGSIRSHVMKKKQ